MGPGSLVFQATTAHERLPSVAISDLNLGAYGSPDGPAIDRLPPQDVQAEQSVLGGMLISKDAIAEAAERLKSNDFYRPAHETLYEAMVDLFSRGEPVDAITVADELTKRGTLQRVGGHAYLHDLIQSVPTAANVGYYAAIVAERSILRRLVAAGTRIVQLGYGEGEGEVDEIVNRAQAEVYAVGDKRGSEDYIPLAQTLEETLTEIEVAGGRSDEFIGVPTGFTELDELLHGLHKGQMIVLAARPAVGKSTFGMDIARCAAIKHRMPTVIFSLEMSRTEISMRVIAAEGSIPLQELRKGTLGDTGWAKIAKVVGRISDSPLYIDDSPNMSLMEIRAKARRLKQQHKLQLVVIDYLQLMSSGKKVESRQQEVSEFSRALKLLAKELEVPVIAISQLNRGPEQRTDKRPQMSDLRESGCLPADTKILRADTGAEVTLGELYASGERDIEVWALDESLRYVRRPMTHVFSTGVAPVFRLTLASGKTVRATENHPFHTYDGWLPLAALRTGTRVAVPRHVYAPRALTEWDDARAVALAREVAAGQAVVGADVFALPKPQIALFVASLFEAAGSVVVGDDNEGRISLPVCRAAADVTTRLLLRFGIQTRIAGVGTEVVLDVDGVDSQRRFLQEIGLGARDQAAAATLLASVRAAGADPALHGSDDSVWHNVSAAMSTQDVGAERETGSGAAVLTRITELLDSADLDLSAVNDVFWDEVVSVVPAGIEEVFDATVLGTHNFVADGVAVHNSIEQDADVVILLHKDKEREGEADVLVVKHRNGPTKDLVLGFQGHYARFSNMAASGGF